MTSPKVAAKCVLAALLIACSPVQGAVSRRAKPSYASASHKAAVHSVDVVDNRIVVRGAYLGRVEVFATATGTGVYPTHVDNAKLGTAHGKSEEWFVTIPPETDTPSYYLAGEADLFFKATDKSGRRLRGRYRLMCGKRPCYGHELWELTYHCAPNSNCAPDDQPPATQ